MLSCRGGGIMHNREQEENQQGMGNLCGTDGDRKMGSAPSSERAREPERAARVEHKKTARAPSGMDFPARESQRTGAMTRHE